ncbi:uncharacterized protein LY89DRAFT_665278 [Mollisia scopiformis]|uniref:Uncharacterized protein n=1 Tax=Mollisia scopiformis TaxID=149040 RepID=A0A194XQY9_MOLSC|nr:uncharacterized protein LY89DRAFT_665278 [Mollisia scopiformis]KUJ22147.1 hypothetical protein LY89DRAFT_665278 [Mollisia scopiformis]
MNSTSSSSHGAEATNRQELVRKRGYDAEITVHIGGIQRDEMKQIGLYWPLRKQMSHNVDIFNRHDYRIEEDLSKAVPTKRKANAGNHSICAQYLTEKYIEVFIDLQSLH